MKRFLVALFLSTSMALCSAAVHAGAFPGNGDVNDDGSRDLSDAVFLLAHLFQGGPAPAVCPIIEPPADPEVLLPATNQTVCYDTTFVEDFPPELLPVPDCDVFNCTDPQTFPACWEAEFPGGVDPRYCLETLVSLIPLPDETVAPNGTVEVACPTAPDPGAGQDGAYQIGCPTAGRFVDNTDGTVTDTCTGLMWTQDIVDADNSGVRDHDDNVNWCAALNACEDLDFATHTDWRLPNIRELESIVDYGRVPTIDPVFADFVIDPGAVPPRVTGFLYWSSTTYDDGTGPNPNAVGSADLAHVVFFADSDLAYLIPRYAGSLRVCLKSDDDCFSTDERWDKTYVRAVRTVPLSAGAGGAGTRGQGAATLGNGDVNGDDSLDLSDAIYLLAFLFQGGPEPVDCPGGGGDGEGIPDVVNLGRLTSTLMIDPFADDCYEEVAPDDWGTQDCAIVTCPGQDSFYEEQGQNSCQGMTNEFDRFVDNGDRTVTDHCTNLMWYKGDVFPTPELGGRLDWHQALAYAESVVLVDVFPIPTFKTEVEAAMAGDTVIYDDWRVPNIRELETIRDYDKLGQNLAGFLVARRAAYFSSTTIPSKPSWVFGFLPFARIHIQKNNPQYHVRFCRTVTVTP